jgi:phage-related protein (TIGR01555 family)
MPKRAAKKRQRPASPSKARKAAPAATPKQKGTIEFPVSLPPPWKINDDVVVRSKLKAANLVPVVFTLPTPPPRVIPRDHKGLAMDDAIVEINGWAANQVYDGAYFNGVAWLGYTLLAELFQRPEYRRVSEVLATEMTRKWIKLKSTATDKESKTGRIKELDKELQRLDIRGAFRKVAELDGGFGRAHLYLDTGDTDNGDELLTSIGNGRDAPTELKFKGKRGFLRAVKPVEPVWCYPAKYNSNDPLKPDWYNPQSWFCLGKEIHSTRLLTFVGREVPDLLKPSYSFGGLSLSQMAKPYIDNWLRTRQAVADLIWSFSVRGLKTNMADGLNDGGDQLFKRAALFANFQSNQGVMLLDKDKEDFFNIVTPLGSLDVLQGQAQEHMCSVTGTPVVKLLGIQPAGLNASSQGELTTWYDWVAAFQEKFFREKLTKVIDFAQLSLWGEIDPDITYEFEALEELSEKDLADKRKVEADTDVALVGAGILDPVEVRKRLAADPQTPYDGLDVEQVPEGVPGEEDDGPDLGSMIGQLGARDPAAREEGRRPDEEGDRTGARRDDDRRGDRERDGRARESREFARDEQQRDKDGKFAGGGGGGGHAAATSGELAEHHGRLDAHGFNMKSKTGGGTGTSPTQVYQKKVGQHIHTVTANPDGSWTHSAKHEKGDEERQIKRGWSGTDLSQHLEKEFK